MTIHLIAYVLIPVWIYLSFKDIKTIAYAYIIMRSASDSVSV